MENAVTAGQALRAYTEGPAVAAGLEGRQGRLLPGYDADLVAWDVDPLEAEPGRASRDAVPADDGRRRGGAEGGSIDKISMLILLAFCIVCRWQAFT